MLVNYLTNKGVPICLSSDSGSASTKTHKLCVSSFHQSKGLERKLIIVFNFDSSYFKFFDKHINQKTCPNPLYVASTRCMRELVLVRNVAHEEFPFLAQTPLSAKIDTKIGTLVACTTLVKHIPPIMTNKLLKLIKKTIIPLTPRSVYKIQIPTEIKQKYGKRVLVEPVSDLNGVAIPAYFEYNLTGSCTIFETLKNQDIKFDPTRYDLTKKEDMINLAIQYNTFQSQYTFRSHQIIDRSWLNGVNILERFSALKISKSAKFEVTGSKKYKNVELVGIIDCVDGPNYYEFKCTNALKLSHYLQLIIYSYIFGPANYFLVNLLTGELVLVDTTNNEKIVKILVEKYTDSSLNEESNFENFKNSCIKILKKYDIPADILKLTS